MYSAIDHPVVAAGVEEEFHVVDLGTRRLTAQPGRLMEQLPAGRFSSELQRSALEANSRPWTSLTGLAEDIAELRRAAIAAAEPLGLGIVAAGAVPLADPDTLQITSDPRYEHMRGEYRMLVREQLICGTQVHVDVDDRDLAVAVAHRVAPWLPALLALSGSSPYWLGTDTGYASYRTLIWRRWPTAGALPGFASAADYDQAVADLVRSGVITDPGMIYFDVRPSAHLPTLELRICDSCPRLEDVVLLAGLFRALVIRNPRLRRELPGGVRARELLQAATGGLLPDLGLEGDLVDPVIADPAPVDRLDRTAAGGMRFPALASMLRPGACHRADQLLALELGSSQRHCSAPRAPAAASATSSTCSIANPRHPTLAAANQTRSAHVSAPTAKAPAGDVRKCSGDCGQPDSYRRSLSRAGCHRPNGDRHGPGHPSPHRPGSASSGWYAQAQRLRAGPLSRRLPSGAPGRPGRAPLLLHGVSRYTPGDLRLFGLVHAQLGSAPAASAGLAQTLDAGDRRPRRRHRWARHGG